MNAETTEEKVDSVAKAALDPAANFFFGSALAKNFQKLKGMRLLAFADTERDLILIN